MTVSDRDEMNLDDLFAEARNLRPQPSDALVARLLADAAAVSRERLLSGPALAPPLRPGRLRSIAEALGGWPALGGLAASTVLGLLLGVTQPAGLSTLAGALWSDGVSVSLGLDEDPLSLLEG